MKHANVALFIPHLGCPHHCSFCDQRAITGQGDIPGARDVVRAAEIGKESLGERAREAEIAFFGGSFTAIDRSYMDSLLSAAYPFIQRGDYRGIRVSTRPDAIDEKILSHLRKMGVTSIELSAQSMDDRVLSLNRRGHVSADVERASCLIRENGFSLGLQMMTGLYGDTAEGAWRTARALAALCPDTMRIYPAIVMKNTQLARWYAAGEYVPVSLEQAVELCADLLDYFESKGIRVIRLGLHDGSQLEKERIAGPWHPAFRELCESRRYFKKARVLLERKNRRGQRSVLLVHPSAVSQMTGQKKENLIRLSQEGYEVRVKACVEMPRGGVALEESMQK